MLEMYKSVMTCFVNEISFDSISDQPLLFCADLEKLHSNLTKSNSFRKWLDTKKARAMPEPFKVLIEYKLFNNR